MAIKVLDPITIRAYNLTLNNLILTIQANFNISTPFREIQPPQQPRVYKVNTTVYFYTNRDVRYINCESRSYDLTEEQLSINIMEYIYNQLKLEYPNYENC